MSNGKVKKVSPQDVQLVQDLIERCLQLYMSQKQVVSTLLHQAQIEPSFTQVVWQKLEEENKDFFKAYHLRLILKGQIMKYNKLLQAQAESLVFLYNTGQTMNLENMHRSTVATLRGAVTYGGPSVHPIMHSADGMSGLSRRELMGQNLNMGFMQGINGEGMIKSESGYAKEHSYIYNPARNVLERNRTVTADLSSFGFLSQIPRNFSLSDLTADFSISSDILDSYSRSPYLNPHGNGDIQGDGKRPDTISEGLSYEGFDSD